jgi:hypothetical protein
MAPQTPTGEGYPVESRSLQPTAALTAVAPLAICVATCTSAVMVRWSQRVLKMRRKGVVKDIFSDNFHPSSTAFQSSVPHSLGSQLATTSLKLCSANDSKSVDVCCVGGRRFRSSDRCQGVRLCDHRFRAGRRISRVSHQVGST